MQPGPVMPTSPNDAVGAVDALWESRLATTWQSLGSVAAPDFVRAIDALAAELPDGHAVGLFERGSAQDSTGRSDRAVPLYQAALAAGLQGLRRRRATIQLASSLRNLGRPRESVELLSAEPEAPEDELSAAVSAFLALALTDVGREREAVGTALGALSRFLPRYNASLARYAASLRDVAPLQPAPADAPTDETRTASCSCGQLTITVHGAPSGVGVCHCLACQRRTGSVFAALAGFAAPYEVAGTATEHVRTGDHGARFRFRFCPSCGSTVFHTEEGREAFGVAVAIGAFADPSFPPPEDSVYDFRRHPWVRLPAGVVVHDADPP